MCILPATAAHADPTTGVALQSMTDGTAPFDASAGPGSDTDPANGEVRSYDTVTYAWAVNVNSSTGGSETFDRVVFTQTLPAELSWPAASVPSYCKGAGWGISGQTLTCVYVPPGGTGNTGTTLNFSLIALAGGELDGTVATPAADSTSAAVSAGATTSAPATATAPPVTIRSAPFLDMYKGQLPQGSIVPSGDPLGAGYFIDYTIGLQVPSGPKQRRGFIMPDAPVTFTDDLSAISPNAQFVSCSGSAACTPGVGQTVDVAFNSLPADPAGNGAIASGTIRVFVPQADVDADPDGNLNTINQLTGLVGHAGPVAASGDLSSNNSASYNLITTGGSGNVTFNKQYLAANGSLLPTQTVANDGNGQVLDGQVLLSQITFRNGSATAPAPTPAMCDVWDATRVHLSGEGPGPAGHGGAPVWVQSVPAGWVQGVDYVIEYGTQAPAAGDDATRWADLRARSACTDASDSWTTTLPGDLSTVTKVRVRALHDIAPASGNALTVRINLKVDDPTSGDLVANFLGRRVNTTWTASGYQPVTNAGNSTGDRVRVNGVTVRIRKRSSNPSVGFGLPATITSGGSVQFELTPTVTALDVGTGIPAAHDVVIRDRLPLGLTFDASRPTTPGGLTPVVTTDGAGLQVLTWTIPTLTKGAEPTLTFWVQSASTAIGPRDNQVVIDSAEDVGGLDTIPASAAGGEQHYAWQTIQLDSPGGVRISKAALQAVVEPVDPLAFRLEYANLTATAAANVDIIDVLPYVGDGVTMGAVPGRNPASTRHGTLPIDTIDVTAGETIRYTNTDPDLVYASSNPATTIDANYGRLPAGKSWCTAGQFGTPGCPTGLDDVTAVRVTRASLPSGGSSTVTLHFAPLGNRSGDVYSNTAAIRYGSGNLGALSNVATSRVVASAIGDYVWRDANADGIQDPGEDPVRNLLVTLTGTDKHGRSISVQTRTDADGKYRFTSSSQAGEDAGVRDLVSGTYTVTFARPDGYRFTTRHAPGSTVANDSDADPESGSASATIPDPSPTGADGQDLDVDAGFVRVPPASPTKEDPEPDTPVTSPPPKGNVPPGGGEKPTHGDTGAGASGGDAQPRLTITKRAVKRKVVAGDAIAYVIEVGNRGDAAAHGVVACDTPGSGLTVGRVPKGARFDAGRLCWRLGTLRAGTRHTVRVTMQTVLSASARTVRNVAVVSARDVRPRRAQAGVRVMGNPAAVANANVGVTG